MRGYLYVADPEGREIPGSRRSLAGVERGTGQFAAIEAELQRTAGDDCTVRYSETERRLRPGDALGLLVFLFVFGSVALGAWQMAGGTVP